jgi:peptidoglycan/LPS O-acetylase OafA/YrhL
MSDTAQDSAGRIAPPPLGAKRQTPEIKAMTGLRGVAAMLVATYHFYPDCVGATSAVGRFVGKGYLWVDLFFILSGFLMAMNYAHLFAAGWSLGGWVDFLMRRLARIYPLYLVVIVVSLGYTFLNYGTLGASNPAPAVTLERPAQAVAANVLMIQSWGIAASVNGAAWSLSTEWAAYLLFPLLLAMALFGRSRLALAGGLAAAALTATTAGLTASDGAYHTGPLDAYDGTTIEPILRCFGGFLLGMLTYRLAQSTRALAIASHDASVALVIGLLAAGFATGAHDLAVYPLFALLVLGLYGNRGWIGRLLGCRPIHWLGVVSYSVYLLHAYLVPARGALEDRLQHWLPGLWGTIAASFMVYGLLLLGSGLTYRAIEEPGRRCLQRLARIAVPARSAAEAIG